MAHWLLTWTTYGTWLPGDERGYVGKTLTGTAARRTPDRPGDPYAYDHPLTQNVARAKLKRAPVRLSQSQAALAAAEMQQAAARNDVGVLAGAVMADHCHAVVDADDPSRAMNVLKGAGGRALAVAAGTKGMPWWTTGGKKDRIRDARHLDSAIRYVRNQRGLLAAFGGE
jgi:REP element-mobilizing transposase RayT